MTIPNLKNQLLKALKPLGAFLWHEAKTSDSIYIKFRDSRLGSIRLSDHNPRARYGYTYDLRINDLELESKTIEMIYKIFAKSKTIYNFNPKLFIVYDKELKDYLEVNSEKEFKEYIFIPRKRKKQWVN